MPFSSHCPEKDKQDTLFSGFEFMTSDSCTSDNCHGSCLVSFLYFLYKLDRILSVKTLGNPDIRKLVFYQSWTYLNFIWLRVNLNPFFLIQTYLFEKRIKIPRQIITPKSYPDYCKAMRLCNYLNFTLFTFNKIGSSFISTFYAFIIIMA